MANIPLTVFVGAGVSKDSGAPLFDTLRDDLIRANLPRRFQSGFRVAADTLLAPEQVFYQAGSDATSQRLVREYVAGRFSGLPPNANHFLLADVLRSGGTVWTTNYDVLIEEAQGTGVQAAVRGLSNPPRDLAGVLLKPHGSLSFPERDGSAALLFNSVHVLSPTPFVWADAMQRSMRGRDVLVWGYRGRDPDLMPLLGNALLDARSVTWVARDSDSELDRIRQLISRNIDFPGDGGWSFDELRGWLVDTYLPLCGVDIGPRSRRQAGGLLSARRIAPELKPESRATIVSNAHLELCGRSLPPQAGPRLARRVLLAGFVRERRPELWYRFLRSLFNDVKGAGTSYLLAVKVGPRRPLGGDSAPWADFAWLAAKELSGVSPRDTVRLLDILGDSSRRIRDTAGSGAMDFFRLVRAVRFLENLHEFQEVVDFVGGPDDWLGKAIRERHPTVMGNHLVNVSVAARSRGDLSVLEKVRESSEAWLPFLTRAWQQLLLAELACGAMAVGDFPRARGYIVRAKYVGIESNALSASDDVRAVEFRLTWYEAWRDEQRLPNPAPLRQRDGRYRRYLSNLAWAEHLRILGKPNESRKRLAKAKRLLPIGAPLDACAALVAGGDSFPSSVPYLRRIAARRLEVAYGCGPVDRNAVALLLP